MDNLVSQETLFRLFGGVDVFTIENIIFNILIATVLALFIYLIYKKTFSGVMYSQSFNVTIVMVTIVTAVVMMIIGNNLALSLGMVGSLSIIRFRTAIKEPRDVGFIFWGIAVGLSAGTGEFIIAIIGSVVIAIVLMIFNRVLYADYSYLLITKGFQLDTQDVNNVLQGYKIPSKLRMKITNNDLYEITHEITLKSLSDDILINSLRAVEGVEEVHLVSFNGEISG